MMIKKYDDIKLTQFIKNYKAHKLNPSKVQMPFNIIVNGKSFYVIMSYVNADEEQSSSYSVSGFYLYIEPGYIHKNDNYCSTDGTACKLVLASDYNSKKQIKSAHTLWIKPFTKGIADILVHNYNNNSVRAENYVVNYAKKLQKKNQSIKDTLSSLGNVSKMDLWDKSKIKKFLQEYDVTNA